MTEFVLIQVTKFEVLPVTLHLFGVSNNLCFKVKNSINIDLICLIVFEVCISLLETDSNSW